MKMLALSLFFCTIIVSPKARQATTKAWPGTAWAAGFMTDGPSASSFRHFFLLPDGTVQIMAPGETPKPFPYIDRVLALSAGTFHMLALKSDGTVWAWGRNDEKELGNEKLLKGNTPSAVPVQVAGLTNAVAVSACGQNSYALLQNGTVWAWGNATRGQTGDNGPLTSSLMNDTRGLPVKVYGITNAVAIAGPVALLADGTVMTWGEGYRGQLGNGGNEPSTVPVKVQGLNNVTAIAYRSAGAMALKKDGTVWTWGANEKGQLGRKPNSDHDQSNVPVQISGISDAVAIGADAVCIALLKDGTVRVWGWGAVGGMGQGRPGTNDVNSVPLKVPGIGRVVAVKSGNGYGLALQADGTLVGWGANTVATGIYHQTWTPVKMAHIAMTTGEKANLPKE